MHSQNPATSLSSIPIPSDILGSIWPTGWGSQGEASVWDGIPSTTPAGSQPGPNTSAENGGTQRRRSGLQVSPLVRAAHPFQERPEVRRRAGPRLKLPAHRHNGLLTSTATEPSESQVGTRPPGELQAPLTSGPAGDGFPGMRLVIGGVITV